MKRKNIENWIFVIISVLLISFQLGIYFKSCKFPNFLDFNMLMLYVALLMPWIIRKAEKANKKLAAALLLLYFIYFVITFVGFINLINHPLLNCEGTISLTLENV